MAKSFDELRKKMSPERQTAVAARVRQLMAEMPLGPKAKTKDAPPSLNDKMKND